MIYLLSISHSTAILQTIIIPKTQVNSKIFLIFKIYLSNESLRVGGVRFVMSSSAQDLYSDIMVSSNDSFFCLAETAGRVLDRSPKRKNSFHFLKSYD